MIVSVHTTLNPLAVDSLMVYVNGVPVAAWTVEVQSFLVARFLLDEGRHTRALLANSLNTLTLVGFTKSGQPFWAETKITVVDADHTIRS